MTGLHRLPFSEQALLNNAVDARADFHLARTGHLTDVFVIDSDIGGRGFLHSDLGGRHAAAGAWHIGGLAASRQQ